jgi:PAS domain S-box-containing protein
MRLTTIRDVSEQKAAEQRLTEALELNRTLIAASTVGIAAFKSTGECVSANEALARITGGTLDQLLRVNFRTLEPWRRYQILPRAEEVLRTRQPQQFDVNATSSFGKEVSLTIYFASFMSQDELHLLYMVTDISERMRAGEALRASEERFRAVVEDQTEIIARFRPDGVFTFVNDAYCRLFGKTKQELLGCKWQPLFVAEDLALIEAKLRTMSPAHPVVVLENRILSGSGEIRWMQFVNRGLFDPEGRLVETQSVGRDITEQKRAEREILEISEREQARIGQDLHDSLCQQLVSLAFDANSLQRKFAAHELPEAVIAGRLARVLDQAITESRRLARGLFPIRLQAEGLASALEELAQSISHRFPVQCRFDCPQPVPVKDHAVATHLYRIAQEALNNSLKHAQAGTLSIQLRSDAGSLELRVQDDGIGLPETPARPGGMGLHIMHYRAATLGATLCIGPGPAGGTIVSCCVPSPSGESFAR